MRHVSDAAQKLLDELCSGPNHAVIGVYPDVGAFEDHAIAHLNTAQVLCRNTSATDFLIFTVLYNVRHGIELWLKGSIARTTFDRAARTIKTVDSSFDTLAATIGCTNASRSTLRTALCVLRNVLQDGLKQPDCARKRISERYADRAVAFLRSSEGQRYIGYLPMSWAASIDGHDLLTLWEKARDDILSVEDEGRYHLGDLDGRSIAGERIDAIVNLLSNLDEGGDVFRYPCSLTGSWHLSLSGLSISLDKLGKLALELENGVRFYRSAADSGVRWWSAMPMPWDE